MTESYNIWVLIIGLGIGTYLIRFSFMGLVGDRPLPAWLLRHLRYTAVAILPALCAPLVLWPEATGGQPHPIYIAAAVSALLSAYWLRNAIWGVVIGGVVLYGLLWLAA